MAPCRWLTRRLRRPYWLPWPAATAQIQQGVFLSRQAGSLAGQGRASRPGQGRASRPGQVSLALALGRRICYTFWDAAWILWRVSPALLACCGDGSVAALWRVSPALNPRWDGSVSALWSGGGEDPTSVSGECVLDAATWWRTEAHIPSAPDLLGSLWSAEVVSREGSWTDPPVPAVAAASDDTIPLRAATVI